MVLAKSLPFAGPSRTVVSSRWRSRADQSLRIEEAADRLLGALGGQVAGRRVDEGRDLELVVELDRAARRPDGVVRAADLRDVGEVEDRQPVPRLGDLLAAPLPGRARRAARRRRSRGGWAAAGSAGPNSRSAASRTQSSSGVAAPATAGERGAEARDPDPGGEQVVERPDRPAEQRLVVGERRVRARQPAARDLEVEPARSAVPDRRGKPPGRSRGRVALADVGELHGWALYGPVIDRCFAGRDKDRVRTGARGLVRSMSSPIVAR